MAFGERVVDTQGAAGLADHRAPESGGEHPLVQAVPGVTERGLERDAVAGPEPVQGDREVVDTDLGHGGLLTVDSQTRRFVRDRLLGRSCAAAAPGGPFCRAKAA